MNRIFNTLIKDIMILTLIAELLIANAGNKTINEVCLGIWGIVFLMDLFTPAGD